MDIRKGWWANMEGFWLGNGFGQVMFDRYNDSRKVKTQDGRTPGPTWCLRTPGRLNRFIMGVGGDGALGFTGYGVEGKRGIRPAMWVKI